MTKQQATLPVLLEPDDRCTVESKCWGNTRRVGIGSHWDIHYLQLVQGGYCSRHRHTNKWNLFYVASGRVAVEFFNDGESEPYKIVEIGPDERLTVPSRVWHRFRVLENGSMIEVYWPDRWNPDDIERAEEGGFIEPIICQSYSALKIESACDVGIGTCNTPYKWIDTGE